MWSLFCDQQIWHKVDSVLRDPERALYGELERLPHGRRYRSLAHKTNRRGNSFVPTVVRILNGAWSAIWTVWTILCGFTRVAVWFGSIGVYRSSDAGLVDDSSGVCMHVGWGVCMWVPWVCMCCAGVRGRWWARGIYMFSAAIICITDQHKIQYECLLLSI